MGIARALAQRPRMMLADEPVASLDPAASERILALLGRYVDKMGFQQLSACTNSTTRACLPIVSWACHMARWSSTARLTNSTVRF